MIIFQGPTDDPVISKLRMAFVALVMEYKIYTDMEREKVIALGVVFLESAFVAHSELLKSFIEWYKEISYGIESNLNGRVSKRKET